MILVKHGLTYFSSKILPAIFTILTIAVFTRELTPEEYGVYSITILASGFFVSVMFQWVMLGVGRYLPGSSETGEEKILLSTARGLISLLCVFFVIAAACAVFFEVNFRTSVDIYALTFLVAAKVLHDLKLKILNSQQRPLSYGAVLGLKSVSAFLLGWGALVVGWGAQGALLGLATGLVLSTLIGGNIWKNIPWITIEKVEVRRLWKYGAPLTVTFLLVFIIDASDRFFIDQILGAGEVGEYSAAYDFTQYSIGTLLAVVHLTAFPIVLKAYATDVNLAKKKLKQTFTFVLIILTPACAGLAAISDEISSIIFGSGFAESATFLIPWLTLALFFSCLRSFYFDYAFQLASMNSKQVYIMFVAAIINLSLNAVLIPNYGLLGAAWATVSAFFVALLGSAILGSRVFDMPRIDHKTVLKISASVGMMLIAENMFQTTGVFFLALKLLFCVSIYMLFIFILNVGGFRDYMFKSKLYK